MQFQPMDTPPFTCTAARAGHAYFDAKGKRLRFCDGTVWRSLSDGCGNGVLELGEDCDDGNNKGGDGCSETCELVCGDGFQLGNETCDDNNTKDGDGCSSSCALESGLEASKPATSCKALRAAGAGKDGSYWIDPDGNGALAAQQLWCDMTTAGGGWTIVYAATGADGEQPATGNGAKTGKPFALEHYNLPRAEKLAISGTGTETLLWRGKDVWLRVGHVPFDGKLVSGGSSQWSALVIAPGGQNTGGYIGFSTTNINGGGDFGVTNGAGFDHHSGNYWMLNGGCVNHFLYSYSSASNDGDAGYDVNTGLGAWTATTSCAGDEGGQLKFYMAVR
ncbi:MAG: DUF4215 domain-containing protein [Deltaproteobacteria bacterium]|nr:DUF4215 domain-containing protein [Deltaproteobacteria bacterium]